MGKTVNGGDVNVSNQPGFPVLGENFQSSPNGGEPLSHIAKANAAVGVVIDAVDVEPGTIILDDQPNSFAMEDQAQLNAISMLGMFVDVCEGFLGDPKQDGVDLVREVDAISLETHGEEQPIVDIEFAAQVFKGLWQAQHIECSRA